ncbi:MAG: site-specific integrase [Sarcina sp.]|nr:site-specific integrase [Sarcina sp.]
MPTAKKLPSGSWRCRVFSHYEIKPNGKKKPVYESFTVKDPSRTGKRECERMAAEWAASKRSRQAAETTVQAAVRQYIDLKEHVLSPATVRSYESYLRSRMDDIRLYSLGGLTAQEVQGWINGLSAKYSPKYVRNIYGLFTAAVAFAGVDLPFRVSLPAKQEFLAHVPCDEEVQVLIGYLRKPPRDKRDAESRRELLTAIMLAAFGSMRRGEICALTVDDFHGCHVSVTKDMVQNKNYAWIVKPTPKTSASNRTVELPQAIVDQIQLPDHGRIMKAHPEQITNRFRRAIKRCGADIPFRFHDLRHYYVSIAHALGIPDAYVMEMGGWRTEHVMKRVYRSTLADRKRTEQDRLNEHFGIFIAGM